jgi:phosphoribosylformylglycinamidine synthase PurS subunit
VNFAVHVEIRGLEAIADPEGRTIERALPVLGFAGVQSVRVGKVVRFSLEAEDEATARREVDEMCRRLLANPVIEQAEVEIEPLGSTSA